MTVTPDPGREQGGARLAGRRRPQRLGGTARGGRGCGAWSVHSPVSRRRSDLVLPGLGYGQRTAITPSHPPNDPLNDPRPTPLRLPAAERRRQLLDVAIEVFAEHGLHGASMNQVAEAAGVTKPVLYQHFRSKRALYCEVLEDVGSRLEDAVIKATADAEGPRQQVEAGFRTYFRWVAAEPAEFGLLFAGGARGNDGFADTTRRVETTIADAVAALIDVEGLDAMHRRVLAHGIVGIAEATSRHWMVNDLPLDPEDLAARTAELAWAGLRRVRHP